LERLKKTTEVLRIAVSQSEMLKEHLANESLKLYLSTRLDLKNV
jgi:hypothetical protein